MHTASCHVHFVLLRSGRSLSQLFSLVICKDNETMWVLYIQYQQKEVEKLIRLGDISKIIVIAMTYFARQYDNKNLKMIISCGKNVKWIASCCFLSLFCCLQNNFIEGILLLHRTDVKSMQVRHFSPHFSIKKRTKQIRSH